ncbi:MAG: hypothetical protein R2799_04395 [Crocinitomicaceae bacterium]|nr:hypothetical protein [Crocinitomicaceae bacterium]
MKELDNSTIESSKLAEQAFNFWFKDKEHIRSPFPDYIRPQLKRDSTEKFFEWAKNVPEKAKEELNEEMIGEKFEELIFETAMGLVKTEDEKITILYPFLPRIGDKIVNENNEEQIVTDRSILKDADHSFLKVKITDSKTGKISETKFELPFTV